MREELKKMKAETEKGYEALQAAVAAAKMSRAQHEQQYNSMQLGQERVYYANQVVMLDKQIARLDKAMKFVRMVANEIYAK